MTSPKQRAIDLTAARLATGVLHPGNPAKDQPAKLLTLPGFNSTGIPPEMAAHFANQAGLPDNDAPKLWAEAIIHLLTTDGGLEFVDRADAEQMRAQLAEPDPAQGAQVTLCCRCQPGKPLLIVSSKAMVTVNGPALREHISTVCTCREG